MKSPKIDSSGTEAAQKAVADAQAAANNLRQNFQTDLKTENMTQVVAGGSAAAVDAAPTGRRRRGSGAAGLASQLGING